LNKRAYFFAADVLLLPADFPDSQLEKGLSPEYISEFSETEVFDIPSLGSSCSDICVVSVPPGTVLPKNWKGIPARQILTTMVLQKADPSCLFRALHFSQWRRDSRFCGACGAKNDDAAQPPHRICPVCGRLEFPRICPAIIIAVTDEKNRLLLAHNKGFREGLFSLIAGFNEPGESLEETAAREVREEVSINIKDIEYVNSQPWPFPNSLMIGFKARYASGTLKPDGAEIQDAAWFTKENLPDIPGGGSLSRLLIDRWLTNKL